MSKSLATINDLTLLGLVARAINPEPKPGRAVTTRQAAAEQEQRAVATQQAKRVLAALGLDDLDEAAIRSIDAWAHEYANDDWRDLSAEEQLAVARGVLEAALTATNR